MKDNVIKCTKIKIANGDYELYFYNDVTGIRKLNHQLSVKNQGVVSLSPLAIKVNTDASLTITMEFNVEEGEEAMFSYQSSTKTITDLKSCDKNANVATCSVNIATLGAYKLLFNKIITPFEFKIQCK